VEKGDRPNAPWGVALALSMLGTFSHALLIGRLPVVDTESSGYIAVYDLTTGRFRGCPDLSGNARHQRHRALSPGNTSPLILPVPCNRGLFHCRPKPRLWRAVRYITPPSFELSRGNDQ
jgi:hypothetical protein